MAESVGLLSSPVKDCVPPNPSNGTFGSRITIDEDDQRWKHSTPWRTRVIGVLLGACVAVLVVMGVQGSPGAGLVKTRSFLGSSSSSKTSTLGQVSSVLNTPGPLPGLATHIDSISTATKFRMITFCNKSYWMFARTLLESIKAVSPSLVEFWTIIVADEDTKKYIEGEIGQGGVKVDIFVDTDLQKVVLKNRGASKEDLKAMLSWRRVHALQALIDNDYTAVFLEPDTAIQVNPLPMIHEHLLKYDVLLASDYGLGKMARKHASSKIIIAKPSLQAKKLLNVWQSAEGSYFGEGAEIGFFQKEVVPHLDEITAKVKILDQTVVGNFLSHHEMAKQAFVTGTGCDDVNYKINFMTQVLRHVQPTDPNAPVPKFDYDGVAHGCDASGRAKVFKLSNEYAKQMASSSKE